jgi:alpha-amylase
MRKFFLLSLLFIVLVSACAPTLPHRSDQNYVYYEIFVASFYDSDGDGMGDLRGVEAKLPYLDEMGIGGIWLMPIMPSPTYHKYDVVDYTAIDPAYGTMEDFESLIAAASALNIDIIIDLVINHSSSQHPWFKAAKHDRLNDRCDEPDNFCDYYVFTQTPRSGYYAIGRGFYYEALFWSEMPDLNLDHPPVREAFVDIARFWLDKGVKGFRLDAVTYFYEQDVPRNNAFLAWFNQEVKAIRADAYMVAEAWASEFTISRYIESQIDSFFNFPLSQADGRIASTVRSKRGHALAEWVARYNTSLRAVNPHALDATFISNHDQGRSAAYFRRGDLQPLKQMASLYILMPGRAFVYYGEEIGMRGSGIDENKRLPMIWSVNDRSGQTRPPTGATYVDDLEAGVQEQRRDANSLWRHYQRVIHIKNRYDLITDGQHRALNLNDQVYALESSSEQASVIVIHNLSDETQTLTYDFSGYRLVEQIDHGSNQRARLSAQSLSIGAGNSVILQRKS